MQRYHFHFKWRDDAVFDEEGIELENFPAAYLHACGLVHQVRRRFPAAGSDWWIEISTGIDTIDNDSPFYGAGRQYSQTQGLVAKRLTGADDISLDHFRL